MQINGRFEKHPKRYRALTGTLIPGPFRVHNSPLCLENGVVYSGQTPQSFRPVWERQSPAHGFLLENITDQLIKRKIRVITKKRVLNYLQVSVADSGC